MRNASQTFAGFLDDLTMLLRALPDSLRVVKTFIGLLALTALASSSTKWLRREPVRRADVLFLGLPMAKNLLFLY